MENETEKTVTRFNDSDEWRWYEKDGQIVPSVTTYLGAYLGGDDIDFLLSIDKDTYRFVMNATAKSGNEIQELCERSFKPDFTMDERETKKYGKVMKNWAWMKEKYNIRPIKWGRRVFSKKYGYAGEIDLEALIDHPIYGKDIIVILDLKTGKYRMQAAYQVEAYREELIEEGVYKAHELFSGVLHLHRDGSTRKLYIYEHHDWLFLSFLSIMRVVRADFKNKLSKEPSEDWKGFDWMYHCPFRAYFGLPQPTEKPIEVDPTID